MGLIAPSALGKKLGIRMQNVYSLVTRGVIEGHRPEGAKSIMVDEAEATEALRKARKVTRGPRQPKAPSARALKTGDIFVATGGKKSLRHRQVVSRLEPEEGDDPNYQGLLHVQNTRGGKWGDEHIDAAFWAKAIKDGVAMVESPQRLLSMLVFQFVQNQEDDLANSLEKWMTRHGMEVTLPEDY